MNAPAQTISDPKAATQPTDQPSNAGKMDEPSPSSQTAQPTKQADDLLARVTAYQKESASATDPQSPSDPSQPDTLEATIASIEDPEVRSKFEKLRKDLVSGTNQKFQEIATLRKEMQSFMEQSKSSQGSDEWTPERVQALANDPKFIAAASKVSGVSQDDTDEYSVLSDSERSKIAAMEAQLNELKRINQDALKTQQQQLREQQHLQYKSRYHNYDPKEIDQITFEMLEGKIQATPEHIYKAFKHDDNVRKAYELGRQDERSGITDKIDSVSLGGITTQSSEPKVIPKEGESSMSFFQRIAEANLAKLKRK